MPALRVVAYKFVQHEVGPKPDNEITRLLERCADGGKGLTRAEKNRVASLLYGLFGAGGPGYKLGGWEWPMWCYLPRILVKLRHIGWQEFYAPDKTSLRAALKHGIVEMVEAPVREVA